MRWNLKRCEIEKFRALLIEELIMSITGWRNIIEGNSVFTRKKYKITYLLCFSHSWKIEQVTLRRKRKKETLIALTSFEFPSLNFFLITNYIDENDLFARTLESTVVEIEWNSQNE